MFPTNGQNIVFGLYLLGIAVAVLTGWLFRRQIFSEEVTPSFQEMPAYHVPVLRNILLTSWFRLKSFVFRAGRTIILVVIGLSFLNSIGNDGSFGNEDTEQSVLSEIGKTITPIFAPIGLSEDNWPATVGLFTGLFAKEAVVGTLDALYSDSGAETDGDEMPDLVAAGAEALVSIRDNGLDVLANLGDPLGISLESSDDLAGAAETQGVNTSTLTNMAALFGTQFAAFCYLVFVLLYAPCVAVLGAISKEAGPKWMLLTFAWTTGLAYITASCVYQLGTVMEHPVFSLSWIAGCIVVSAIAVRMLRIVGRKAAPAGLIEVVQVT
jgi:ferrous iron transport protein B